MANAPQSSAMDEDKEGGRNAAASQLRIPLHDPVPSIFIDGCHGANIIAGCVRLDLFVEHAWSGSQGTQQMVAGRVVVPVERFEQFARGINLVLKKLQDNKPDKAAEPAAATTN